MNREALEHVLRASAAIAQEKSFVVVGSQAVLLPFPNAPAELLLSNEVDLYPAMHPERAELIEGSIGVLSPFHDTESRRLIERLRTLDPQKYSLDRLEAWARRRANEATPT